MTPAALHLAGPTDAVLCDCGNELSLLWTLDLGRAFQYYILGGIIYAVAAYAPPRMRVGDAAREISVERNGSAFTPFVNPLHATAVCGMCEQPCYFEFTFEGAVVSASRPLGEGSSNG